MQIGAFPHEWYAVRTAAGREKAVSAQLQNKGVEEFLPVYKSRRQWSERKKELEFPLFPGYHFCRFDFSNRLPILITPGVKLIVGYGKIPAPVSEAEIDSLRRAVTSGADAMPWPYLSIGQRLRVQDGSLAGVEGILLQVKNSWRISCRSNCCGVRWRLNSTDAPSPRSRADDRRALPTAVSARCRSPNIPFPVRGLSTM
jgi:transcription antitermination factor NusG